MGWKKKTALALVMVMLLGGLAACGMNSQSLYEQGQWYLGAGEYRAALGIFRELGGYEDAWRCALYCSGLIALEEGEMDRARADFTNLKGFLQSDLYLSYLNARTMEAAGEIDKAKAAYLALGSFEDSYDRALRLEALIPQRDYAAAQSLMALGQYEKAYEAFNALGDYENSRQMALNCQEKLFELALTPSREAMAQGDYAKALELIDQVGFPLTDLMQTQLDQLAESCRAALYAQAAQLEAQGLSSAQETLALYESLGNYQDSAQKAQALADQYGRSMALTDYQGQWQYVALGQYPQGSPILWRVMKRYEGKALLLADKILEARPLCQEGETFTTYEQSSLQDWLTGEFMQKAFTPREQAALAGEEKVFLLSREEAQLLPHNADRQAQGSDHARSQGLRESAQQAGWWWLRDQGELSGCQSIVYFSGVIYDKGVQAYDAQTGVRPAIWLDLEQYPLTQGTGTYEDPYQ